MPHPPFHASMAGLHCSKWVRCARRLSDVVFVWTPLFLDSAQASAEETGGSAPATPRVTPPQVSTLPSTDVPTPRPAAAEVATAEIATAEITAPELAAGAPIARPVDSKKVVARNVEPPPAVEDEEQYWYGWETLTVDAVSAALLVAGASTDLEELGAVGGVGYFLGSPVVHWSHGNVAKGFGSLALRVAATAVLGFGSVVCFNSRSSDNTLPCGVAVLGVVAVPAAVAVDAAVFAYDEPASRDPLASTNLVPWLDRERSATGLNWVGRF